MFRFALAVSSIIFEVISMATEGALALTMIVAGIIITVIQFVCKSNPFEWMIDRLTGFDLPEDPGAGFTAGRS